MLRGDTGDSADPQSDPELDRAVPGSAPRQFLSSSDALIAGALGMLLGLLVGVSGGFVIRYGVAVTVGGFGITPVGLGLALATVLAAGIFARLIGGRWSFMAYLFGALAGAALTWFYAPGGDLLLLGDLTTLIWFSGLALLLLAVALLPRRWFAHAH